MVGVSVAQRFGFSVISDETYRDLVWEPATMISPVDLPGGRDVVVRIRSFSKSYGITGWRIGAVEAIESKMSKIVAVHDLCVVCAPSPAQILLTEILTSSDDILAQNRSELWERVRAAHSSLLRNSLFIKVELPSAGYFFFVGVASGCGNSVGQLLLERANVGIIPGVAFGREFKSFVRVSAAVPYSVLLQALERIESLEEKLRPQYMEV